MQASLVHAIKPLTSSPEGDAVLNPDSPLGEDYNHSIFVLDAVLAAHEYHCDYTNMYPMDCIRISKTRLSFTSRKSRGTALQSL